VIINGEAQELPLGSVDFGFKRYVAVSVSVFLSAVKRPAALISVVKSDSYFRRDDRVNFWELLKLLLVLVLKLAWFFCFRTEVSNKLL
jgi:hypothetical protein